MGYQQRSSPRRSSGRAYGRERREKGKAKEKQHRSAGRNELEESHAPTWEEVADKAIHRLNNLGNQKFALSPFDEYFSNWLIDLREVLTEFESSPVVVVDDEFRGERSRILSSVGSELEKRRSERLSRDEAVKTLSGNKLLLERMETEHAEKTRELEQQKKAKTKRLTKDIEEFKDERDRIAQMKTGFFRRLSTKEKERMEDEATQQLVSARWDLKQATENFSAEKAKLRDEFERKKKPVIEQIQDQQKEVENQEIDWSVEARRDACIALTNAVDALYRRKKASPDGTALQASA